MKTSDLIEQRTAIVARINTAAEKVIAAHNADDDSAFGEAKREQRAAEAELSDVEAKIAESRARDDNDRADRGRLINGVITPEFRNYSLSRRIASIVEPSVDAGREREIEQELARRNGGTAQGIRVPLEYFETRATQTTGNSAAIAPEDFRPELFTSALTNSTIMQSLGATVLSGLQGNLVGPRETSSPNVAWVNEDQAVPIGNASFDNFTLTPHHVGAMAEVSRQLIMQASPAADAILRQMLSRNIALAIDAAAINGSGVGAVPRGILNDPDVDSLVYTGDLFTDTADMIAAADLANVAANRAFVTTRGVKGVAMKMRDAEGRAIPISETFHGERVEFSNQVPNDLGAGDDEHGLVYGDWSDFLIGIWSSLDILVNPYAETAYSKGNILIRAMATVDFGVRRPASFIKLTALTLDGAS